MSKYVLATVYARSGDKNEALNRLEQACEERSWYLGFINLDPELDDLRSDTRFHDLIHPNPPHDFPPMIGQTISHYRILEKLASLESPDKPPDRATKFRHAATT